MKITRRILSPGSADTQAAVFGLTSLRVAVGIFMCLAHGLGKIPPSEKMIEGLGMMGFPAPEFFAWCAGLAECAGGVFLAAGLLTRPAAAFIMITMTVAVFIAHADDPFQKKELALMYFFVSLFFVLRGAGPWSLDQMLDRRRVTPLKR